MGKFSKIHCKRSPFHQEEFATRSLTAGEKKSLSGKKGGIHASMWKAAEDVGKKIFRKK